MPQAMKWWGWGLEGIEFTHEDKPQLAGFIRERIGLDITTATAKPARFEDLGVPEPTLPEALGDALRAAVGAEHVSVDPLDRVIHARGKSIRDLIRTRRADLPRVPDAVLRPGTEEEVAAVLAAALEHDAVVIPFGGGSSISGSIEPPAEETRPVLSVDMSRLDRVLAIDPASRLARVQAGVYGPDLEQQLGAQGFTMGHFPDSFTHSTLGGWIATRSSGMQSDRYGDVADITKGLRVVTPTGTLVVQPNPTMSTGPSIREMVLGSEGRLGIITEATVQVRRLPAERTILGYLFPTFAAGLAAMEEIAASEYTPSVTRVSDAPETQFSFATRKASTLLDTVQSKALQLFLKKRKGYDLEQMCLSFIGYEGSPEHVKAQRKGVGRIVGRHGGLCIGASPGVLYDQKKFDTPYIRDFLLDRGAAADVSETAMPWSKLQAVHTAVTAAGHGAFAQLGVQGYLMCHLSHSYHAGACLYFTFAFPPSPGGDMLAEYDVVKQAIQQAFVDNGATLSHHHAVGTEHAQWLQEDISAPGVRLLGALFDGTDPGRNLNPGKIV
ncbi:FAD-binding protein [Conexibacter sp. W3-3-2]|uniref:FAD-binding oxidoreductase n=1 Tax=Conexibacter sp. W3-3-2 TaxID=2675227 RepID=UPI0012B94A68|nr:FAD-binding oxidoreductase [Conexibacter sp. W3-3-2]MTD44105.1 FAD-binding protein [Conexibacter sp. W3-3-2]